MNASGSLADPLRPARRPPPPQITPLCRCAAGEFHLPGGGRYEGGFERGLAPAGSRGTWTDKMGGRFAVVVRQTVPPWGLRDSEDVFASRERIKARPRRPVVRPPPAACLPACPPAHVPAVRPPARTHARTGAGQGHASVVQYQREINTR